MQRLRVGDALLVSEDGALVSRGDLNVAQGSVRIVQGDLYLPLPSSASSSSLQPHGLDSSTGSREEGDVDGDDDGLVALMIDRTTGRVLPKPKPKPVRSDASTGGIDGDGTKGGQSAEERQTSEDKWRYSVVDRRWTAHLADVHTQASVHARNVQLADLRLLDAHESTSSTTMTSELFPVVATASGGLQRSAALHVAQLSVQESLDLPARVRFPVVATPPGHEGGNHDGHLQLLVVDSETGEVSLASTGSTGSTTTTSQHNKQPQLQQQQKKKKSLNVEISTLKIHEHLEIAETARVSVSSLTIAETLSLPSLAAASDASSASSSNGTIPANLFCFCFVLFCCVIIMDNLHFDAIEMVFVDDIVVVYVVGCCFVENTRNSAKSWTATGESLDLLYFFECGL